MRRTLGELIILFSLAVLIALLCNQFLPIGIPLFGYWDPDKGILNAGGRCKPDIAQISDDLITNYYLKPDIVFVDARPYEKYTEGHIPQAISVPVGEFDDMFLDFMERYPTETVFVIYCSGMECHDSMMLAKMLKEQGYKHLYVYAKGYKGWVSSGRPVKEGELP